MLKVDLQRICGLSPAQADEAVRSILPSTFVSGSGDGKRLELAPASVAVIELVKLLQSAFGESSPVPKDAARQAAPAISTMWHTGQERDLLVEVEGCDLNVTIRPSFISKAKALVAAA